MNSELYDAAFAGQTIRLPDLERPVRFEVHPMGKLVITSGFVVAADPLVCPEMEAFVRDVPLGSHPAEIAVASFEQDSRVAFARIRFRDERVAAWEHAVVEGQDASRLEPDEFFGYPVDSGNGAFMDRDSGGLLEKCMAEDAGFIDDFIARMEDGFPSGWAWTELRPDPNRAHNVLCFTSGWGDGQYPSYFGLCENGEVVTLATDFLVVYDQDDIAAAARHASKQDREEPAPQRKWWQFWAPRGG